MTAKVILNPYSARWRANERFPEVVSALKEAGVDFEMVRSERHHHCTELAEEAAREGFSPILAAGGDGTIGEVVNGLANAVSDDEPLTTFGIIPLGTANDLVSNLKLPTDLRETAQIISAGKTRQMDLCSVNGQFFANNTAIGLEPMVTVIQEEISWLKGIPRYLYAALLGIYRCKNWQAEIKWDDGEYTGPLTLASIGNGARTGGLFYMTPHADLFDGEITFTFGYEKTRLGILRILPLTMKSGEGSFVEREGIYEINTKHLQIKLAESTPAHADGEIFDRELYEAEYRVYPGRLPILMP